MLYNQTLGATDAAHYNNLSFVVGSLNREELEDAASDHGLANLHLPCDDLRSELLEAIARHEITFATRIH